MSNNPTISQYLSERTSRFFCFKIGKNTTAIEDIIVEAKVKRLYAKAYMAYCDVSNSIETICRSMAKIKVEIIFDKHKGNPILIILNTA